MNVVIVSTYPPRRCGIATFTRDLRRGLAVAATGWRVGVCAVDRDGLRYGPEVVAVVRQHRRADYRAAARAMPAGTHLVVIHQARLAVARIGPVPRIAADGRSARGSRDLAHHGHRAAGMV
jgi:hypothetical protein